LLLQRYLSDSSGDFSCDKIFSSPWRLMIEENPIAGVHVVGFPIVNDDPVTVKFCASIWRTRIEGRLFVLRGLDYLTVKL